MTDADEYAPMDISSLLDNEETIAEYLTAAAEDENPDALLLALANVAKARGMARVAEAAGLGRESLYKALAPGAHPRFETIVAVLRALGVTVVVRGSKSADAAPSKAERVVARKGKTMVERVVAKKGKLAAQKHVAKRAPAKRRA